MGLFQTSGSEGPEFSTPLSLLHCLWLKTRVHRRLGVATVNTDRIRLVDALLLSQGFSRKAVLELVQSPVPVLCKHQSTLGEQELWA